jgi:hypothetical protein
MARFNQRVQWVFEKGKQTSEVVVEVVGAKQLCVELFATQV